MNKKIAALFSVVIIIAFMGYILIDSLKSGSEPAETPLPGEGMPEDMWQPAKEIKIDDGRLSSVACGSDASVYLGGDSFIICLNPDFTRKWKLLTGSPVTALAVSGDTVYAASEEIITLAGTDGRLLTEWGPYETNSIITSVSCSRKYVGFADAGSKRIFILDKTGAVHSMVGQSENNFIIPSPYFDVALTDDQTFLAANTGMRRIETWSTEGKLLSYFGEPGSAPGAFCGCCNPAHFTLIPGGLVTAEKGINRIKILSSDGSFNEFVTSRNKFTASLPLDIATLDGKTLFAANPGDSKLYIFIRKNDTK